MRMVINMLRAKLTDETWETLRIVLNDKFEVRLATSNRFLDKMSYQAIHGISKKCHVLHGIVSILKKSDEFSACVGMEV